METTDTAPVVRAGRAVRVYLGSAYPGVDEFARITRSALQQEADSFRHPGREAVIDTLADGLLLSELRAVTGQVLRRRLSAVESSFRLDLSRAVGYAILNPDDFVSELDRSKLLQVLLLSDDEEIYRGIDAAIASGELRMAEYDVRVERVSRTSPATRAELGVMGVRVREKGVRTYVAGRLLRLIHHLFFVSGVQSREDLQYLAGPDTRELSDSDLLNHVVHSISPDEVLDKLVTSTRASAIAAAEYFWISEPERLTSADLRRILLWKLGLPGAIAFGDIATLDERLRELRNSAESSVGEDVVRGQISNVFAAFEDVLQRSLAFTCWALATDHLTTTAGFEYDPSSSASGLRVLDELAPVDDAALALRQSGKNTLAPLGAGFGRLAKALVRVVPNDFVRPESHLPDICRFSDRPFAFAHTVPFLDLDSAARDELARTIGSVASAAQDDVVLTVRNSTLHGNNIFPSSAAVTAAVDVLSACSSALRRSGLFPTVFELEMRSVDGFGRETVTFRSDRSRVKLSSPHWAVTRRMPTSSDRLVIMPAARLSSVGPLRFRLKSNLTGDDYWDGWPRRWQERRDYDSSLDSDADEVSSAIAS